MLSLSIILESLDIVRRMKLEPVSQEEVLNMEGLTIFDDIGMDKETYYKNITDFKNTNHYKIFVDDLFIGVIGFNNYYDTWKDNPAMLPSDGRGKKSLWIQMLEITKEAREKINNPLVLIKSVLEYLNNYCKENGFKSILCSAKTERIATLYRRAGFIGRDKDFLAYIVK